MKFLFILTLSGLNSFALFAQQQVADTVRTATDSLIQEIEITPDTITVIGVGDIMMGTNYPDGAKLPPENGSFLLRDVEAILSNADLTFGNLEGVLLDSGGTPKTCRDPKVCYVFRSPVAYVDNLLKSGFDVMSLANNHAGDFGDVGRTSSMRTLDSAGIYHAGQLAHPFVTFTIDSVRYGLTALAPNSGCVQLNDIENAKKIVQHLDSISDIVIVSFHGGAEGAQYQHVPRSIEMFHGENRGDVYQLSRELIDVGADIIFGHGPHVTRAIDVYKNRFIAYSLGNFCTYRGISVSGVNGLSPIVKLYVGKDGEFYKGEIVPTYQTYDTGVRVDAEKRVISVIRELTKKDFPESEIQIDDNGLITYLAR
ncbi:MAG TPA: CapA family protein [Cyclobacteriaceae bacterium]|nr:CapA family protein [Cyclobacteriaceae bacterium]